MIPEMLAIAELMLRYPTAGLKFQRRGNLKCKLANF